MFWSTPLPTASSSSFLWLEVEEVMTIPSIVQDVEGDHKVSICNIVPCCLVANADNSCSVDYDVVPLSAQAPQ
jgi:hypothetical protein